MVLVDKKGRRIKITGDYEVKAFYGNCQIGSIEFTDRDGKAALYAMNVDQNYRNAGIGTAMMRRAAELHGKSFEKPDLNAVGSRDASSDSYYTDEGAALIKRCIREGILDDTSYDERDDDFDDM